MDRVRRQQLEDALATRILILDGAMGTMLQARRPTADDYGGPGLDACNENLCHTRPEWVLAVHRAYLDAGADIVSTNTFQGSPIVLAEFGLEGNARALNIAAARLARQAAGEFATGSRPRFVAGALGPTTRSITLRGDVTFPQLRDTYYTQARALIEGGVDLLLFETVFDTRSVKAGLLAVQQLERDLDVRIPLMVSATIEPSGTMLAGQAVNAFYASIGHADLLSIGLNCSTGPDVMADHIRTLASIATTRISCHPNAGLPDEEGDYLETPESLAGQLDAFVQRGWLNIVGGCCGTTPAHIRALAGMVDGRAPHAVNPPARRALYSGIDLVEAGPATRPLIVGERTNVMGSRLFKRLIAQEQWDDAGEIARAQVRHGAQLIDVCLQSTDRDETRDVDPFYAALMPKIRVPVMIDTTDARGVERALAWCQGKAVINSITLEDGEAQFERVCPLARAFGAAIVVGTIDEDVRQAQAFTRERKVAVAARAVRVAVTHGIAPEDLIVDPLVFPCGTGDESYIGGAVETIEAIRLIKAEIPLVKTMISVSAVSFGLPDAAREVVNTVFLDHAVDAGVDLAMVNTETLKPSGAIPPEERRLAENLLFNRPVPDAGDERLRAAPEDWRQQTHEQKTGLNQVHVAALVDHFRRTAPVRGADSGTRRRAPVDDRLSSCIVEGVRDGLLADLDEQLKAGVPALDIINGPLMAGMTEVGRRFSRNQRIVAEVLRSAEVMHVAVRHLQSFMPAAGMPVRGTIVLGTVKGDVHDIGKNLVEIILANNGYSVINLGIKVPAADVIQAACEHRADAIGLSGLLVKSAHQMVAVAMELKESGVGVPLIVGGAALSEKFTRTRIGPAYAAPTFYAADAMAGLHIMNQLMDPAARDSVIRRHIFTAAETPWANVSHEVRLKPDATSDPPRPWDPASAGLRGLATRSSKVRADVAIPAAPGLDRHVCEIRDLREVWSYINPSTLYGRHLGFKGRFEQRLAGRDPKALELFQRVEAAKDDAAAFMKVRAVWQFFEAEREANAIHLFRAGAADPLHTFQFARQQSPGGLCLSDYVLDARDGRRDHVGLFVVTAGDGIRQRADAAKRRGEFLFSHIVQALALETAEGAAEWVHRRMREAWGFPDPPALTMGQRWAGRYRGKRYSFGYAACPNLEDQEGVWRLLNPDEIGVQLTEGFMMDPEASVSALVFHHPDCVYFATALPDGTV